MSTSAGTSRLKLVLLVLLYVLAIGFAAVETRGREIASQTQVGR